MKITSILLITIVVFITTGCGFTVKYTVHKIDRINEVQGKYVGFEGKPSKNYKNFEKLKQKAELQTLIQLTDHENPVVCCYASWALIEKGYTGFPSIFSKYLIADKRVATHSGCIKSEDYLSHIIYDWLWDSTEYKGTNKMLMTVDSVIIFDDRPNRLLLERALENRVYPRSYNTRIATLAFDKAYTGAIFYLSNWYRADYKEALRTAFLKYLENTNFTEVRIISYNERLADYYKTVAELLKFHDDEIKQIIIQKLKNDRFWEHDKETFTILLDQYHISQSDLRK